MKLFEVYLREYLTPEQRADFAHYEVNANARAATDHFFGVGNDMIREDVPDNTASAAKGEVHLAIEKAIGQEISIEDYKKGTVKDRYNRDVKIGRLIKDEKLRNQFASDPARQGVRKSGYYATIHRGVEVAGQTNSKPNETHPQGHSWGGQSCKNVDTGSNRHYLKNEIQAGTVVIFVHDPSGKEIYRATLHPCTNRAGQFLYSLDAQYGVISAANTEYAKDVARRLSVSEDQVTKIENHAFHLNRNVYADSSSYVQIPYAHQLNCEDLLNININELSVPRDEIETYQIMMRKLLKDESKKNKLSYDDYTRGLSSKIYSRVFLTSRIPEGILRQLLFDTEVSMDTKKYLISYQSMAQQFIDELWDDPSLRMLVVYWCANEGIEYVTHEKVFHGVLKMYINYLDSGLHDKNNPHIQDFYLKKFTANTLITPDEVVELFRAALMSKEHQASDYDIRQMFVRMHSNIHFNVKSLEEIFTILEQALPHNTSLRDDIASIVDSILQSTPILPSDLEQLIDKASEELKPLMMVYACSQSVGDTIQLQKYAQLLFTKYVGIAAAHMHQIFSSSKYLNSEFLRTMMRDSTISPGIRRRVAMYFSAPFDEMLSLIGHPEYHEVERTIWSELMTDWRMFDMLLKPENISPENKKSILRGLTIDPTVLNRIHMHGFQELMKELRPSSAQMAQMIPELNAAYAEFLQTILDRRRAKSIQARKRRMQKKPGSKS